MLARNETIFKWTLYAGAALLLFCLQTFLLQRFTLWGVIPFLYPVIAAVPATYEGPVSGTIYALAVGVCCDLLLPSPVPCFYTLVFPVVGLCAALISQSLLSTGFFCALLSSLTAFLLTDLAHCLLLWARGKGAWQSGLLVMVREFCVTAVWIIPAAALFSSVFRRVHLDD